MTIARAVQLSLRRHLWHPTQELVVIVLFDKSLDRDVRSSMATQLLQTQIPQMFAPGKPEFPQMNNIPTLVQFIGTRSWLLFHLMYVDDTWLKMDPEEWETCDDYVIMRNTVRYLAVVNNATERGMKDVQDYANSAADVAERETRYAYGIYSSAIWV